MEVTSVETRETEEPRRRSAPGLAGIFGRLRVDVHGEPAGVIVVTDGQVELRRGDGDAEAVALTDDRATLEAIASGTLNPVVAALQGRLRLTGDRAFAVRVILGLQVRERQG